MAWSFTDLRYGWKIATGIALASTTIYVANNTRWRVNQADVIELALGVHERCLATQYSTNPVAYRVAPLSFVRNWVSNDYSTGAAVPYTNTFTNTIGQRTERAMMDELDTKIYALIPYYLDTNTMLPLTVTGLFASLQIGDRTNKFTRTPAIGTNAATYGEYPWRIYVEDLQERYKVLNALEMTAVSPTFAGAGPSGQTIKLKRASSLPTHYDLLVAWLDEPWQWFGGLIGGDGNQFGCYGWKNSDSTAWSFTRKALCLTNVSFFSSTNLTMLSADVYGNTLTNTGFFTYDPVTTNTIYYDPDQNTTSPSPILLTNFALPSTEIGCLEYGLFDGPGDLFPESMFFPDTGVGYQVGESYNVLLKVHILWQFNYCTNKYW